MTTGELIRDARKNRGLTQIETAEKAGISVNSLRLYEADKREPRFDVLCSIANALDVHWEHLFQGIVDSNFAEALREDNLSELLCFALEHPDFISFLSNHGFELDLTPDRQIKISWNGIETETNVDELDFVRRMTLDAFTSLAREHFGFDIPDTPDDK